MGKVSALNQLTFNQLKNAKLLALQANFMVNAFR